MVCVNINLLHNSRKEKVLLTTEAILDSIEIILALTGLFLIRKILIVVFTNVIL